MHNGGAQTPQTTDPNLPRTLLVVARYIKHHAGDLLNAAGWIERQSRFLPDLPGSISPPAAVPEAHAASEAPVLSRKPHAVKRSKPVRAPARSRRALKPSTPIPAPPGTCAAALCETVEAMLGPFNAAELFEAARTRSEDLTAKLTGTWLCRAAERGIVDRVGRGRYQRAGSSAHERAAAMAKQVRAEVDERRSAERTAP